MRARDMKWLRIVRRRAERDLLGRQAKSRDHAVLRQRQGLEHLDCRADEADVAWIAAAGNEPAVGVGDRDVHDVP